MSPSTLACSVVLGLSDPYEDSGAVAREGRAAGDGAKDAEAGGTEGSTDGSKDALSPPL
jgi:hypothetical protein